MKNNDHLSLEEWIEFTKHEFDNDYEAIADRVKLDFTEDLLGYMHELGLSKADLAERIGCSRPYLTKIFAGDTNMTIETMVKMATAIGLHLHFQLDRPNAGRKSETNIFATAHYRDLAIEHPDWIKTKSDNTTINRFGNETNIDTVAA